MSALRWLLAPQRLRIAIFVSLVTAAGSSLLLSRVPVQQLDVAGERVARMPATAWALMLLSCVALLLTSFCLLAIRHRGARALSAIVAAMFVFVAGIAMPSMMLDRAVVSDDSFEVTTSGFWFNWKRERFRFDDVRSLWVKREVESGRRESRHKILRIELKDQSTREVPHGDLLQAIEPELMLRAGRRGVPFIDIE